MEEMNDDRQTESQEVSHNDDAATTVDDEEPEDSAPVVSDSEEREAERESTEIEPMDTDAQPIGGLTDSQEEGDTAEPSSVTAPEEDAAASESDSDSQRLVIAENAASKKKSPRKRTRMSSGAGEPTRTLPSRNKGRGMAYLLAMEKGKSKKKLAEAQAQMEMQDNSVPTNESDQGIKTEPSAEAVKTPQEGTEPKIPATPVATAHAPAAVVTPTTVPTKSRPSTGKKSYGGTNISSPIYREPFQHGWRREVVFRATVDTGNKTLCDVYYYTPTGKKLRSGREVTEFLEKTNSPLSIENFTYFKEPLGCDIGEVIRYAKRRDEIERRPPKKEKAVKPKEEEPKKPVDVSGNDTTAVAAEPGIEVTESTTGEDAGSPNRKRKAEGQGQLKVKLWGKKFKEPESKENTEPVVPLYKEEPVPCSLTCSKAEGILPAKTCQRCFALFHEACTAGGTSEYCPPCSFRQVDGAPIPTTDTAAAVKFATPAEVGHLFVALDAAVPRPPKPGAPKLHAFQQNLELINGKRFISVGSSEIAKPESVASHPSKKSSASPERRSPAKSSPKRVRTQSKPPEPTLLVAEEPPRRIEDGVSSEYLSFLSYAYHGLLHVFRFLTVQELMAASRVCKLWRELAFHPSHWQVVRLKNSAIYDWPSFTAHLRRTGTQHLDMRKMLFTASPEATWADFQKGCRNLSELSRIDLCKCPSSVLENVASHCPRLKGLSAESISSPLVSLSAVGSLVELEDLKLRGTDPLSIKDNLDELGNLTRLKSLSLTSFRNVQAKSLAFLSRLHNLESLEFGDCTLLTNGDSYKALTTLTSLRRLRLEQGPPTVKSLDILKSLSSIEGLAELEIVDFGAGNTPDDFFEGFTALRRLLIIPRYTQDIAASTVESLVSSLPALQQLEHLTWALTDSVVVWLEAGTVNVKPEIPQRSSFSLDKMRLFVKEKMPQTEVKIVRLSEAATRRYNLSRSPGN